MVIIIYLQSLLNEIANYSLLDVIQLTGAILAFILGVLEYKKNRVSLVINLNQEEFTSEIRSNNDQEPNTYITILADIRNKGRKPTTISGAKFFSHIISLNNLEMRMCDTVRMDENHREEIKLYLTTYEFLPKEIQNIEATIIFKAGDKDIKEKISLIRK